VTDPWDIRGSRVTRPRESLHTPTYRPFPFPCAGFKRPGPLVVLSAEIRVWDGYARKIPRDPIRLASAEEGPSAGQHVGQGWKCGDAEDRGLGLRPQLPRHLEAPDRALRT